MLLWFCGVVTVISHQLLSTIWLWSRLTRNSFFFSVFNLHNMRNINQGWGVWLPDVCTALALCCWICYFAFHFPSLSTRFLHSCRESGRYFWSFVPGYGMVNQAWDVMLLYANVCVPAWLSVLLEERSVLNFPVQILAVNVHIGVEINVRSWVESWCGLFWRACFFPAESNGNSLAWAKCWFSMRVY